MGALEVIFGGPRKMRVGLVNFDASVSETHTKRNSIPQHPVESGKNVSDHIRQEPDEITINGIVTDHPIIFLASIQAESPLEDDLTPVNDRADLAYAELGRVMNDGELVEIVTTLRDYENMAITEFAVQRDAQNGNVMNATISAREVRIVTTETVEAPEADNPANAPPVDAGNKPPTPAGAGASGSVLLKLIGG